MAIAFHERKPIKCVLLLLLLLLLVLLLLCIRRTRERTHSYTHTYTRSTRVQWKQSLHFSVHSSMCACMHACVCVNHVYHGVLLFFSIWIVSHSFGWNASFELGFSFLSLAKSIYFLNAKYASIENGVIFAINHEIFSHKFGWYVSSNNETCQIYRKHVVIKSVNMHTHSASHRLYIGQPQTKWCACVWVRAEMKWIDCHRHSERHFKWFGKSRIRSCQIENTHTRTNAWQTHLAAYCYCIVSSDSKLSFVRYNWRDYTQHFRREPKAPTPSSNSVDFMQQIGFNNTHTQRDTSALSIHLHTHTLNDSQEREKKKNACTVNFDDIYSFLYFQGGNCGGFISVLLIIGTDDDYDQNRLSRK